MEAELAFVVSLIDRALFEIFNVTGPVKPVGFVGRGFEDLYLK